MCATDMTSRDRVRFSYPNNALYVGGRPVGGACGDPEQAPWLDGLPQFQKPGLRAVQSLQEVEKHKVCSTDLIGYPG